MNTNLARPFRHSLLGCVAVLLAGQAMADTITLKTAARQRDGHNTVTLGDIAVLEGDSAARLEAVQVAELRSHSGEPIVVSIAEVRRALDAAGADWSKVHLSGRSVIVRPARDADSLAPQAMGAAAIEAESEPVASAETAVTLDRWVGQLTIAGAVGSLLLTNLRIDGAHVRVSVREADRPLLEQPWQSGRFEIHPLGSLAADRVALAIRRWNGAAVEDVGQILLTIERLIDVHVAVRDLARGTTLTAGDVEVRPTWVKSSESNLAAWRDSVHGSIASRSLKAGELIRLRDIERQALIERGDLVMVRCLVGGIAISMQAEARASGAIGEIIEFRKSGERESFLARVTAPGQAIVDLAQSR